jgi:hypothetical protein
MKRGVPQRTGRAGLFWCRPARGHSEPFSRPKRVGARHGSSVLLIVLLGDNAGDSKSVIGYAAVEATHVASLQYGRVDPISLRRVYACREYVARRGGNSLVLVENAGDFLEHMRHGNGSISGLEIATYPLISA